MNRIESRANLTANFNLECNEIPQCSVSDATACFNFLNSLGHQACTVPGPFLDGHAIFCTAGSCNWFGENFDTSGKSVSSFWYVLFLKYISFCTDAQVPSNSSDVATGGAAIIFGCAQTNNLVSGESHKIIMDQSECESIYLFF
jgi:hypothetical protein